MHCDKNDPTCICADCMVCDCDTCSKFDDFARDLVEQIAGGQTELDQALEELQVGMTKGLAIFERITLAADMHMWSVFNSIGNYLGVLRANPLFSEKANEWNAEYQEIIDTTFALALSSEAAEFKLPDVLNKWTIDTLPAIFVAMQMQVQEYCT